MLALTAATLLTIWEEGGPRSSIRSALRLLAAAWPGRSAEEWARASVGERDAGLLRLREELFGDQVETTAVCPQCRERLELIFKTEEIRAFKPDPRISDQSGQTVFAQASPPRLQLKTGGYAVDFRLPNSADLMELAQVSTASPIDARQFLWRRCIEQAEHEGVQVDALALPGEVVLAVSEAMAQADPQADVRIALECPNCGGSWSLVFDILSYLWSEIEDWAQQLLLEVHTLARAYGWSEREITNMSARRRRLYLDLLGASISG